MTAIVMESAKIREAMNRLESVMLSRDMIVDMEQGDIDEGPCKTYACHAGYYALACISEDTELGRDRRMMFNKKAAQQNQAYEYGIHWLSKDLGFINESYNCLGDWAENNPDLWGNEDGARMFYCESAFGISVGNEDYQFPLQRIIDHWRAVADRIDAVEATQLQATDYGKAA